MPELTNADDHYEVLGLRSKNEALDEKAVKAAYRRMLLLHHPDKSGPTSKPKPSIDQITIAYKTLIDPQARSEYDRSQALRRLAATARTQTHHSSCDGVDLDDLVYDETRSVWYRSCRCGRERAYVVTEEELEANTEYGEVITGCGGCSLWLRVTFAIAENG
ncbi:Diphthamide biosynthesis protein 4 [Lecanora helva]